MLTRLVSCLVFILSLVHISANATDKYRSDRVLVKRKYSASIEKMDSLHKTIGSKLITAYDAPVGLELVRISNKMDVSSALAYYNNDPDVEYAEPDYYFHTLSTPNDQDYSKQWGLQTISVLPAWDITKGSDDVVVGIIDTGVLYTHPDLVDNIWANPGEIPANGIDDDNNGYVDDVHGINAITKKGDPLDDHGHGTHVAGIIGARGDNSIGISGVNQRVKIAACKFLDAMGSGSSGDAITCINYFASLKDRANHPVNLIVTNNSWGGGSFSAALRDAIKAHEQKGILFVAAAGNDGRNNDNYETYPANYGLPNMISVAATDSNDVLASFSNFGSRTVDVAAPGKKILSTYLGNGYKELSGTSMAAPHVTGLVGLLKAARPDLDAYGLRNLIVSGGQKTAAANNTTVSGRRISAVMGNGVGSLSCVNQEVSKRLAPKETELTLAVGASVDFKFLHINCESAAGAPSVASEAPLSFTDNRGFYVSQFAPPQSGTYHFDFGGGDMVLVNVYNPASWHPYSAAADTTFQYRQITGQRIDLADDAVSTINSPFPIHFAGDEGGLVKLNVGSNGVISFTDAGITSWQNAELPMKTVQTLVAPYWDDLIPDHNNGGGVYYDVVGTAPARELVIEYRNVGLFSSSGGLTFQVVFFENSSDILFNYLNVDLSGNRGNGKSASVGVQTSQSQAMQFSYNTPKLTNNMALRFTRTP